MFTFLVCNLLLIMDVTIYYKDNCTHCFQDNFLLSKIMLLKKLWKYVNQIIRAQMYNAIYLHPGILQLVAYNFTPITKKRHNCHYMVTNISCIQINQLLGGRRRLNSKYNSIIVIVRYPYDLFFNTYHI